MRPDAVYGELLKDFPLYAKHLLKVRSKEGGLVPFILNEAQRRLYREMRRRREETGRVRFVVLKARQMGFSTMIDGLYYWRLIQDIERQCTIVAHNKESASALYKIQRRFYESDVANLKAKTSSSTELVLARTNSRVSFVTAGGHEVGRGTTNQMLHMSEVAYWPNGHELLSGLLQSVSSGDGSYVVLESTAQGTNNVFYDFWQETVQGSNGYDAFFAPWFWSVDYCLGDGTFEVGKLDEEEIFLRQQHGVSDGQLAWRRQKIGELAGNVERFRQEYPSTAMEAFTVSQFLGLFSPIVVREARKRVCVPEMTTWNRAVGGLDIGLKGVSKTVLVVRNDRAMLDAIEYDMSDPLDGCKSIVQDFKRYNLEKLYIDAGCERSVVFRLIELGVPHEAVVMVDFGGRALDARQYKNRKAEIYFRLSKWFDTGVSIPDLDVIESELLAHEYKSGSDGGQVSLRSKADMIKQLKHSPDYADAMALVMVVEDAVIMSDFSLMALGDANEMRYGGSANDFSGGCPYTGY